MTLQHALVYIAASLTLAGHALPHFAGTEVIVRSGSWSGGKGAQGRWRLRAEVDRSSGTLRGEISIDGSRSITRARLEGRMKDTSLRATLKDDGGRSLARLDGKVKGEAASGRYEMKDGDRGTWSSP